LEVEFEGELAQEELVQGLEGAGFEVDGDGFRGGGGGRVGEGLAGRDCCWEEEERLGGFGWLGV
jgi:hypothetical protein